MAGTILLERFRRNHDENEAWLRELRHLLPSHKVEEWIWGTELDLQEERWKDVEYAVTWFLPLSELAKLPKLRAVLLHGAGADHLRPFNVLPAHIPIVRLVDPEVARDMAAFALHWVMHYHFCFDEYMANQAAGKWKKLPPYLARFEFNVGILGLGNIGSEVCNAMRALGYRVSAWTRSPRELEGVHTFTGDRLDTFLSEVNALVNVLPLTAETENLLDAERLQMLPRGSVVISMGRGATVDDDALCEALDSGHLKAAVLDTFWKEPLPPHSPLWANKKVIVTPHISGRTFARTAAKYVADNIKRIRNGEEPFPLIDKERGY